MNTTLFNTICNIISFIASIITIVAALCSLRSLSQLNKFKNNLYKRENCQILIKKLSKIIISIKKEINLNGITNKNINLTIAYLETLIKGNSFLIENSEIHLNTIRNIEKINKNNLDDFIDSIKAIIRLYEQGEQYDEIQ